MSLLYSLQLRGRGGGGDGTLKSKGWLRVASSPLPLRQSHGLHTQASPGPRLPINKVSWPSHPQVLSVTWAKLRMTGGTKTFQPPLLFLMPALCALPAPLPWASVEGAQPGTDTHQSRHGHLGWLLRGSLTPSTPFFPNPALHLLGS